MTGPFFKQLCLFRDSNKSLYRRFVKLFMELESVFFCRVKDTEKPNVVQLIQDYNSKLITLAIGDGANDLAMMKKASLGIGISNSYDSQVARECDYMIGEFRHLKPLMFCFGRECYRRNTRIYLFMIFKSIIFALSPFWHGFFAYFTAGIFYDQFIM